MNVQKIKLYVDLCFDCVNSCLDIYTKFQEKKKSIDKRKSKFPDDIPASGDDDDAN